MERLVCPLCKGPLRADPEAYYCDPCGRTYPVLCGIPDFRILPDRYISIEEDRRKGQRLFEEGAGRDFAGMLDLYWSLTPEVPAPLAKKFREHQLAEDAIGEGIERELPETGGSLLDLGCQTGGLLVAVARRFSRLIGVDVAFRWLVAGQVRLRQAGVTACLICANAEHLPFADASFELAAANDLIEHVLDPGPVFRECHRVLAAGGSAYFSTNNRYSLLPEPHVSVWGVGWMPRAMQAEYVQSLSGQTYRNICLRSGAELRAWASEAGFHSVRLGPAPLSSPPGWLPGVQACYGSLRESPLAAPVLSRLGPRIQLLCRK